MLITTARITMRDLSEVKEEEEEEGEEEEEESNLNLRLYGASIHLAEHNANLPWVRPGSFWHTTSIFATTRLSLQNDSNDLPPNFNFPRPTIPSR